MVSCMAGAAAIVLTNCSAASAIRCCTELTHCTRRNASSLTSGFPIRPAFMPVPAGNANADTGAIGTMSRIRVIRFFGSYTVTPYVGLKALPAWRHAMSPIRVMPYGHRR
jgi:hypothetical protein